MADKPLTFESLLGPAPARSKATDAKGRRLVRRRSEGQVIAVLDPRPYALELPWLVVYCAPDHPDASRYPTGRRLSEQEVGPWPFLNQWGYHEDWVLEQIAGLKKYIKALQRTNGQTSAKLGATRAELARAHAKIRELEDRSAKPQLHPQRTEQAEPRFNVGDLVDGMGFRRRGEVVEVRHETMPTLTGTPYETWRYGVLWPGTGRRPVTAWHSGGELAPHYSPVPRVQPYRERIKALKAAMPAPRPPEKPARFAASCRQVDGTWLHGRPHTCPAWMHHDRS